MPRSVSAPHTRARRGRETAHGGHHAVDGYRQAAEDRQGADGSGGAGIEFQGNAYSLFQTAIVLEDKVRERTARLETALRDLETTNHQLTSAKRQTETAQTRLMEAIESISEGFVLFDRDDRLVLCNTRFIEFWSGVRDIREVVKPGVSFRELSRWTVENGLVASLDGDPEAWLRDRLYRHSNPSDPTVVHLVGGRWLQIRERLTQDGGIVGIYMDITEVKLDEQRRRERELAEKSMLLQSTLDHLVQGVSVFDHQFKLVAWNDRFLELLDLPEWLVRGGASFHDYVRYRSARGDYDEDSESAIALRIEQTRRHCRQKQSRCCTTAPFSRYAAIRCREVVSSRPIPTSRSASWPPAS
ncbi:MAG: PAS domain-containing protein [Rhodospirillales bacterium]|nr:PAS domain-containing protein [Rhodospirillales bacterium]